MAKEDFRKRKQFRIDRLQSQINRAQQEIDMLGEGPMSQGKLRFLSINGPS
jgi:hypothetical protein